MIDFSNLMNVQGNQQRGFSGSPGASAISSIFSPGGAQPAVPPIAPQAGPSSPGLGAAPLNLMPQNASQQPGFPSLEAFLKILQGAFSQPGSAAGGTALSPIPAGSPLTPQGAPAPLGSLPPPSPLASLMQRKQAGGSY